MKPTTVPTKASRGNESLGVVEFVNGIKGLDLRQHPAGDFLERFDIDDLAPAVADEIIAHLHYCLKNYAGTDAEENPIFRLSIVLEAPTSVRDDMASLLLRLPAAGDSRLPKRTEHLLLRQLIDGAALGVSKLSPWIEFLDPDGTEMGAELALKSRPEVIRALLRTVGEYRQLPAPVIDSLFTLLRDKALALDAAAVFRDEVINPDRVRGVLDRMVTRLGDLRREHISRRDPLPYTETEAVFKAFAGMSQSVRRELDYHHFGFVMYGGAVDWRAEAATQCRTAWHRLRDLCVPLFEPQGPIHAGFYTTAGEALKQNDPFPLSVLTQEEHEHRVDRGFDTAVLGPLVNAINSVHPTDPEVWEPLAFLRRSQAEAAQWLQASWPRAYREPRACTIHQGPRAPLPDGIQLESSGREELGLGSFRRIMEYPWLWMDLRDGPIAGFFQCSSEILTNIFRRIPLPVAVRSSIQSHKNVELLVEALYADHHLGRGPKVLALPHLKIDALPANLVELVKNQVIQGLEVGTADARSYSREELVFSSDHADALRQLRYLRTSDVSRPELDNREWPHLRAVSLSGNRLHNENFVSLICRLIDKAPKLRALMIAEVNFDDATEEALLEALTRHPSIEFFDLRHSLISGRIIEGLFSSKLRHLGLSDNSVSSRPCSAELSPTLSSVTVEELLGDVETDRAWWNILASARHPLRLTFPASTVNLRSSRVPGGLVVPWNNPQGCLIDYQSNPGMEPPIGSRGLAVFEQEVRYESDEDRFGAYGESHVTKSTHPLASVLQSVDVSPALAGPFRNFALFHQMVLADEAPAKK